MTPGAKQKSVPPWIFKHEDLVQAVESAQQLGQDALTNTINHIHFTEGVVRVLLQHPDFSESLLLSAHPQPSIGKTVTCSWESGDVAGLTVEGLVLKYLIIDDGRSMIMVPAILKEINREFFVLELPEEGYALGQRQARIRMPGVGELIQNGPCGRASYFSPGIPGQGSTGSFALFDGSTEDGAFFI
jgi:hypothetical protein